MLRGSVKSGACEGMAGATLLPRIRLVSGLVLMVFAFVHLVNAALGLMSIAAMDEARALLLAPWQTPPGLLLLYGALTVHVALGLASLLQAAALLRHLDGCGAGRGRHFHTDPAHRPSDGHAGCPQPCRVRAELCVDPIRLGRWAPNYGLQQVLLVAVVWVHGCIGLLTWLRLRPWWPKVSAFVYPPVFLLPILALLAFVRAGDEALMRLGDDPAFHDRVVEEGRGAASIVSAAPDLAIPGARPLRGPRRARLHAALDPHPASPAGTAGERRVALYRRSDRRHADRRDNSRCEPTASGPTPPFAPAMRAAAHAGCRWKGPAGALSPVSGDEALRLAQLDLGGDVRLACRAVIMRPAHVVVDRLVPVEEAEAAAHGRPPAAAMAGASP